MTVATPDTTKIAGAQTVAGWKALRTKLDAAPSKELWEEAFEEFYRARLKTRYFDPVETLEKNATHSGEGFAIVAILCSLIEFLESTLQGKTYRYRRRNDPVLTIHEYEKSGAIFENFLTTGAPFSAVFDKKLAKDFYTNVRCGLLHEARTKGGWLIHTGKDTDPMIDTTKKIINRKCLQKGFGEFIDSYKISLFADQTLQDAFKRKMDSLCIE
ncbi:hypothetical protein JI664_05640 [Rhodobacter sp. NTK016B]|uniref:hypothetical protein n=1 Tax=Rhodobacter sp. NTK016B TaxID=2759676 RepID=UPI001A909351|nr:hypothetical protein [Rhodobacter sp. NTK016B]MBN8291435.1 hypothetical protein [Rhodobacter sp. NTK016B]